MLQWKIIIDSNQNSFSDNPNFVSTTTFLLDDYPGQGGISPCIDAGATLTSPFDIDYDGTSRPQGSYWDIGANEQQDASQIPPQNVLTNAILNVFPSPFNPITNIEFKISKPSKISLKVFDIIGNEITTLIDETTLSGYHSIYFNGQNLPSGIYICVLNFDENILSKKILLIK